MLSVSRMKPDGAVTSHFYVHMVNFARINHPNFTFSLVNDKWYTKIKSLYAYDEKNSV